MRRPLCLIVALLLLVAANGQKKKNKEALSISGSEWCTPEIYEQNRARPRSNVVPYAEVDDIEKLYYRYSPYYVSLNGAWKVNVSLDFNTRPQNMESEDFSAEGWEVCEIPSSSWLYKGKTLRAPSVRNGQLPQHGNAVFTFVKEFDVPVTWDEYSVFLSLQARSAYYIWVNGDYVGYGEDSRTVSEFDITKHLSLNEKNTIVVQVISASDGSMLECGYPSDFIGITGDVALVLKPAVNVRDYTLRTDYDPGTGMGTLSIDVALNNARRKGRYYVEAEIWTPEGREHAKIGRWVYFDKKNEMRLLLEEGVGRVDPWTAETPNLYTAVLRVRDEKMLLQEAVGTRFGFRTVEVSDGHLLVNGTPIKLRGVLYSGYDNASGLLCSEEQMLHDIELMKRNNVNAVRTTQFSPLPGQFYELCDKYGLYVVCDANLQPYSTKDKALSVDREFCHLFADRMQNMYETLKNHTSIIMWSLGGGRDNGVCIETSYRTLKEKDPTRPVIYGGAKYGDNSDMVAIDNVSDDDLRQYITKNTGRPLLMTSYGNSTGNGFGGMEELWGIVRSSQSLVGGFVNCWRTYRYTDIDTWAEFVPDGIGNTSHPALAELRHIYRPLDVRLTKTSPDEAEFTVHNLMDFRNISDLVLEYRLYTNYKKNIVEGEVPQTVAPGHYSQFRIRVPRMRLYSDEELRVRLVVRPRKDRPGLPRTTAIASFEYQLPMRNVPRDTLAYSQQDDFQMTNEGEILRITGSDFEIDFNTNIGAITGFRKSGTALIRGPLMPQFSRVPTDNDCVDPNGLAAWQQCAENKMTRTVEAVNFRRNAGGAVIDVIARYTGDDSLLLLSEKQIYLILRSGDVLIDNHVTLQPALRGVAKIGMLTTLPKELSKVSWYGGSAETYPDRMGAISIALNTDSASRIFHRYPRPQDAGNRSQVRWLSVANSTSALYADMLDSTFNFSICPYDRQAMLSATDYSRLSEAPVSSLSLDYKVAGLGSALSGSPTANKYRLNASSYHYTLHLKAYNPKEETPGDIRRIQYPDVVSGLLPTPLILSDRQRFDQPLTISLRDTAPGCQIRYTVNGSEPTALSPLYKEPFKIDKTTIIKARAFAPDMSPSFVATRRFDYDYVVSTTFANAPNTPYNQNAANALFDGLTGNVDDLTRSWLGFSGNDIVITVSLGKSISIDKVTMRFAHSPEAWVFAPAGVNIEISEDGRNFTQAATAVIDYDPTSEYMVNPEVKTLTATVHKERVKYIRITARSIGKLPPWHKAKGLKPWMMMDELYVTEGLW